MKLLLHIGTQKTGTTALQEALFDNPAPLNEFGFHYAPFGRSNKAGELAHVYLRRDADPTIHDFLDNQARAARQAGAHTVVVSAEAFYAIELRKALWARRTLHDPIGADHQLISRLFSRIPESIDNVEVVCYFRRPDRYAESFFNQHVKGDHAFAGSFDSYLRLLSPALRYHSYMERWAEVFGNDRCTVRTYEGAHGDIVTDFVRHVLRADGLSERLETSHEANLRLSRDVMEFKRLVNRRLRSRAHALLEQRVLEQVQREIGDDHEPRSYQDYFTPEQRGQLLVELGPEMLALQENFGVADFPPLKADADGEWREYPGLSPQRRRELARKYREVRQRAPFRTERATIRRRRLNRRLRRLVALR